jgi:hypothetical protein
LQNLAIDLTRGLFDLTALQELLNLERLSFDGAPFIETYYGEFDVPEQQGDVQQPFPGEQTILDQLAQLTWPVADPEAPERGLVFLSLDNYQSGLSTWSSETQSGGWGSLYIGAPGTYTFTTEDSDYG